MSSPSRVPRDVRHTSSALAPGQSDVASPRVISRRLSASLERATEHHLPAAAVPRERLQWTLEAVRPADSSSTQASPRSPHALVLLRPPLPHEHEQQHHQQPLAPFSVAPEQNQELAPQRLAHGRDLASPYPTTPHRLESSSATLPPGATFTSPRRPPASPRRHPATAEALPQAEAPALTAQLPAGLPSSPRRMPGRPSPAPVENTSFQTPPHPARGMIESAASTAPQSERDSDDDRPGSHARRFTEGAAAYFAALEAGERAADILGRVCAKAAANANAAKRQNRAVNNSLLDTSAANTAGSGSTKSSSFATTSTASSGATPPQTSLARTLQLLHDLSLIHI